MISNRKTYYKYEILFFQEEDQGESQQQTFSAASKASSSCTSQSCTLQFYKATHKKVAILKQQTPEHILKNLHKSTIS